MDHTDEVNIIRKLIAEGKVKTKGRYEVMPFDKIGWHKNHSAMVIAMAATYELLSMGDSEEFIRLHQDKFDFCLRTKVPRSSRLVLVVDGEDVPQQNICRYYPVKEGGGKLIKIMPPLKDGDPERRLGVDTSWSVKTCNDIADFKWDIDYNYYINEARKLINDVSENVTDKRAKNSARIENKDED